MCFLGQKGTLFSHYVLFLLFLLSIMPVLFKHVSFHSGFHSSNINPQCYIVKQLLCTCSVDLDCAMSEIINTVVATLTVKKMYPRKRNTKVTMETLFLKRKWFSSRVIASGDCVNPIFTRGLLNHCGLFPDQIWAAQSMAWRDILNISKSDRKSGFRLYLARAWHVSKKTCDFYPLHLSWII